MAPLRVLHVDDDANIRALIDMAFALSGDAEVRSCASGEEAIEALESGAPADILLLDVMMPGMDGPAVLERMRALPATATPPVAFMTAQADEADLTRLMGLGAIGVIAKPFDPLTLPQEVRNLMAKAADE